MKVRNMIKVVAMLINLKPIFDGATIYVGCTKM